MLWRASYLLPDRQRIPAGRPDPQRCAHPPETTWPGEETYFAPYAIRRIIEVMNSSRIHEAAGGLVTSDSEVLAGKPVFRGTRVPAACLFEYLADGLSLDYFLESFPSVTREQAVAVLRYGQQRTEEELAA